ncbi:MAG TPA: hypothetical protein VJM49_16185 [Acidimicrobiales bacterium]|nr:hypothetical protein [Acidimicrobiales bacterium]
MELVVELVVAELDGVTDGRAVGSARPAPPHAARTPASVAAATVTRNLLMVPASRSPAARGGETHLLTPDRVDPMTDREDSSGAVAVGLVNQAGHQGVCTG